MQPSHLVLSAIIPLVLLVLFVPPSQSTFPLVVGTATILTASQLSALFAIGLLAKIGSIIGSGVLLAKRRGKREAIIEEIYNIETLVELEEEDCYKMIFCAASSGQLENKNIKSILQLLEKDMTQLAAPVSRGAGEMLEAARYGGIRKSVQKCENRYKCSIKLDAIDQLFQS